MTTIEKRELGRTGRRLTTLGWMFSRSDTPHAQRQRARRLATSPDAARRFLEWNVR